MIEIKRGVVKELLFTRTGISGYQVSLDNGEEKCIAYPEMVGDIKPGDEVLVNTTAVSLKLGSGGFHFIIANLNSQGQDLEPGGHIMKLRYTPMQIKVMSVEEPESPHHQEIKAADSLESTPVLVATLHSMLAPMCLMLNQNGFKVAYVMTDGAALPLAFSQTVDWLKKKGMLAGTVTVGHAFGGDLEAVNIYSGLLAAYKVLKADIIIVSMGPGIVGTGTKWGFTGIEQGEILNAAETLKGIPIAVPRISFADQRERHHGVSHHTITVLSRVCRIPALVPLPWMEQERLDLVLTQLNRAGLSQKHKLCLEDGTPVLDIINHSGMKITTMGRGADEDREFFLTLGACALTALRLKKGEKPRYLLLS